ncbi:MAG TPA: hypothetical protein VK447_00300 [Myxococcaceae bacterium]|nr:hypothetical protein [Myxococcaceae bacterium]
MNRHPLIRTFSPGLLMVGALLVQACAAAPMKQPLREELVRSMAANYVYDLPLEEVWPHVKVVLTEEGYFPREASDDYVIVTDWREKMGGSMAAGVFSRVMVQGERLEADRCIIRAMRHEALADADDLITGGARAMTRRQAQGLGNLKQRIRTDGQLGARDLLLEWNLLQRLRPEIAKQIQAEAARRLP